MDRPAANSVHSHVFDDAATLAMGAAFDLACVSLRAFSGENDVREAVAMRIIEAAAKGERDPARLHSKALLGFRAEHVSSAPLLLLRIRRGGSLAQ
jgi:hypothetical protein